VRDHAEHLPVLGQHVHRDGGDAAGLRPGGQRADERGAHAPALTGVGHHHADLGHPAAARAGRVAGHGVTDDHAVLDGHHGVDVIASARQHAQCGRARRHAAGEEPQVAGSRRQAAEEVPQRRVVGVAGLPYAYLGSAHGLSMSYHC
jgi:hypothetical protein